MHIRLIVDPSRVWGWHARLIDALRADGHEIDLVQAAEDRRRPLPAAYALLEALERYTARGAPLVHAARIAIADLPAKPAAANAPCDLSLDLTAAGKSGVSGDVTLRYDSGGEDDAVMALCAGRVPLMTLVGGDGMALQQALPAIEKPDALSRALEHLFSRALTLFRAAPRLIVRPQAGDAGTGDRKPWRASRSFPIAAAAMTAAAIRKKLASRVATAPRWRVGYRRTANDRVVDRGRWPNGPYVMLPDDGQRFFADPFPMRRDGVDHVFVEEYPFATGKGVISHFTIDERGRASPTKVVLERPCHLSYPMVFARAGAIWMIPETSNARTIELYRADPFPDRWVFVRTLATDVIASDMTLFDHGDRLWLLGTLAEEGGSTWDGLGAFSAADLFGEWRAHPANPFLIDASCARPAGMMVKTGAGLVRPVQDCRGRYGAALALARVDRLDKDGFSQTVIARLPPDPRWSAVGAHTLNEANGLECVDWIA